MKHRLLLALAAASVAPLGATPAAVAQAAGPRFVDASAEAGLDFVHRTGGWGERYMVETMGSGVAFLDLDGDGAADLYFAQGAATPGHPDPSGGGVQAWRGSPAGRFATTPAHAGLSSDRWGMGVAAADYDDDGFPDLYLTHFGANELLRNNGDGSFSRVEAGVEDSSWSSSAAWADIDADGDLDLYVANYVDFHWDNHKFCGDPRRNLRAYCHPDVYRALADRLYRNEGNGTFVEIGGPAGIADTLDGKGLGVVWGDWDDDGDPDAYVANDSTRNFLYTNVDGSRFVEDGLLGGAGFNSDGQAEAGMGTDWGDADGDGDLDLFVTNLDLETNTYYRNHGGSFVDATRAAGLADPSLLSVGFGTHWLDADHDGDLDLFVANGHIIDNIADFRTNTAWAQPNHLYRNRGDAVFEEVSADAGPGLELTHVSRGSALADYDRDGDLDIAVSNNGQRADLLRNDRPRSPDWITLRLVGRSSPRTAAGARVRLERSDGQVLVREVTAGSSYASSSDPTLHFGLGEARPVAVTVRWPGGGSEHVEGLEPGRHHVLVQGRGAVASRIPRR